MTRTYRSACAVTAAVLAVTVSASAGPVPDRLDRFRELATSQLSAAQILDTGAVAEAYRAAYELLDEEIVESLGSGSVFASTAFLQERLDAFGDAWGGASVRIVRLGRFTVGVFQLGERATGNSVRVYGRLRDEAALLTTMAREGRPSLYPLPAAASAVQFLVAWDGAPSGRGSSRPVRLEQVRQHGDCVNVVWSTADAYPEGLVARTYVVRGSELRVRYELRYPGWVPGCDGQTEQEDVYRLGGATNTYARVSQRQYDAWHRDMRAVAARVFAAVAGGDRRVLTDLVPDARVRDRLPVKLEPDPVCDAVSGPAGEQVSVAASDERGAPWALTFQRAGARWRVTSAGPVIP